MLQQHTQRQTIDSPFEHFLLPKQMATDVTWLLAGQQATVLANTETKRTVIAAWPAQSQAAAQRIT
jgi:hypothetical protein